MEPNTNKKDAAKYKEIEAEKNEQIEKTLEEEPKKKRKRSNSCTSSCSSDCSGSGSGSESGSGSGSGSHNGNTGSSCPAKKSKQEEDDKSTSGAEDDTESNQMVKKPIKSITPPMTPNKNSTSLVTPITSGKSTKLPKKSTEVKSPKKSTEVKWPKKSTDRLPSPKSRNARIQEYMDSIGSLGVSAKLSSTTAQPENPSQPVNLLQTNTVDDSSKANPVGKKSTTDKAKSKSDTSVDKQKKDKKKMPLDSGKNTENVDKEDKDKVDESNKPPEGFDEIPDKEFEKLFKGEHCQNFHGYISGFCLTVL